LLVLTSWQSAMPPAGFNPQRLEGANLGAGLQRTAAAK
jgi:hypothetical protein